MNTRLVFFFLILLLTFFLGIEERAITGEAWGGEKEKSNSQKARGDSKEKEKKEKTSSLVWYDHIKKARKIARREDRDILVNFTGSDWCMWCKKLQREVFSKEVFQKKASQKFVFVELDFPYQRKPQSSHQRSYNFKMKKKYQISGFPTILILDKKGQPVGKTGYRPGGAEKYLEHLKTFVERRKERDRLLKKAKSLQGIEKARVLSQVFSLMKESRVEPFYKNLAKKIVQIDGKNRARLREKYAAFLARYYAGRDDSKSKKYLTILKEVSPSRFKNLEIEVKKLPAIEKKYFRHTPVSPKNLKDALEAFKKLLELEPTGKTAQELHFKLAAIYFRLRQRKKAIEELKKARQAAPKSSLAKKITRLLQHLDK